MAWRSSTTSGATSRKKYAAAPAPTAVASRMVSRLTYRGGLGGLRSRPPRRRHRFSILLRFLRRSGLSSRASLWSALTRNVFFRRPRAGARAKALPALVTALAITPGRGPTRLLKTAAAKSGKYPRGTHGPAARTSSANIITTAFPVERPPPLSFRFPVAPRIPRRVSGLWRSGWAASTPSTSA